MDTQTIYLWCNPRPSPCPRCGGDCCSAEENEPGEWTCGGRCDSAGLHWDDAYNNEPSRVVAAPTGTIGPSK